MRQYIEQDHALLKYIFAIFIRNNDILRKLEYVQLDVEIMVENPFHFSQVYWLDPFDNFRLVSRLCYQQD